MPTRNLADALTEATSTQKGVMTAAQAAKLAGIDAEATKNRTDAATDQAIGSAIGAHDTSGQAHADLRTALQNHAQAISANSQAIGTLDQVKITRPQGGTTGQSLRIAANGTFEWYTPDADTNGSTTFAELSDTPNSYSGAGGRFVAVKSDTTGLEYVAAPSGGSTSAPEQSTRLSHSASVAIPNNAYTTLPWDTEEWDTADLHSATSATERITLPIAGRYLVIGSIRWDVNTTGQRIVRIMRTRGAVVEMVGQDISTTWGTNAVVHHATALVDCQAGDYLTLEAWQSSGGALAVNNGTPRGAAHFFSAARLS